MYCDRILAVFPNGKLTLKNLKDLCEGDNMAKLMAGVSEKIPMRSAILGALIVAIATGVAAFPLWAVIFTILPVFIILFPFRIIGTLHIAAIASMLVWLILI